MTEIINNILSGFAYIYAMRGIGPIFMIIEAVIVFALVIYLGVCLVMFFIGRKYLYRLKQDCDQFLAKNARHSKLVTAVQSLIDQVAKPTFGLRLLFALIVFILRLPFTQFSQFSQLRTSRAGAPSAVNSAVNSASISASISASMENTREALALSERFMRVMVFFHPISGSLQLILYTIYKITLVTKYSLLRVFRSKHHNPKENTDWHEKLTLGLMRAIH